MSLRDGFVHDAAEREDVGAGIRGPAGDLLRRDVAHRSDDSAVGVDCRRHAVAVAKQQLRQPEIENFGVAVVRHHDVLGLQIAVDDVGLMRARQSVRNLNHQIDQRPELSFALDAVAQGLARDVFHRDVVIRVCHADFVNREDVRMVERRRRLGLELKSRDGIAVVARFRRKNLDRDVAAQPRVAGAIDLPHPARADGTKNFVVAETAAGGERQLSLHSC